MIDTLLRVDVQNGNVVFDLPDSGSRRPMLLRALNVKFDGWINRTKAYIKISLLTDKNLVHIGHIYSEYGREITDAAKEIIDEAALREKERYAKQKEQERQERIINTARYKLRDGCGICEHLKRGYCMYAKASCLCTDDAELAFEEHKATGRYHQSTPYPVKGCYWVAESKKIVGLRN